MIRIKHFPYRGERRLTFSADQHRYQRILRNEFGPRLPLQIFLGTPHRPKKVGLAAAGPPQAAGLLLNR